MIKTHTCSMRFCVFPRGPRMRPMKLYPGYAFTYKYTHDMRFIMSPYSTSYISLVNMKGHNHHQSWCRENFVISHLNRQFILTLVILWI